MRIDDHDLDQLRRAAVRAVRSEKMLCFMEPDDVLAAFEELIATLALLREAEDYLALAASRVGASRATEVLNRIRGARRDGRIP